MRGLVAFPVMAVFSCQLAACDGGEVRPTAPGAATPVPAAVPVALDNKAAALVPEPAPGNVKAGVDAWSRGDYATAIEKWSGPAASGDADAQFDLGQAYRLGRGVPMDLEQAENWYRKAAAQGHLGSADVLGLLLFQKGRRAEAIPYLQGAATRGDPRAQYLLGTAHFNGDSGVAKDWVRAYALMTRAAAKGLPQAKKSLSQMDEHVSIEDRQKAVQLAGTMETEEREAKPGSAD